MKRMTFSRHSVLLCCLLIFSGCLCSGASAQTLAFPGADGFGRFAKGARAAAVRSVYIVTNLNDAGPGSFREAVSMPGRIIVFAVGGIVRLNSEISVSANCYIAGQTAPGDGIVFVGKRITFTKASHTIARHLRIRLGATGNSGKDASGLANGANMIFDHMSFTWGMDEVFSINWDGNNQAPDSITIQNSIIGQGLHRENHSAGGLIQTPDGGKISLLRNLYISNKTRNPKVKGVNEFVNNVVYNWGNGGRLDTVPRGYEGDAYIMGGSSGVSEVNVINNYFVSGPLTPPNKTTPFSRGTGTFNIHAAGNYFDSSKNGILDGNLVPFDSTGYPGITGTAFQAVAYPYPQANPVLSAAQAYQRVIDSVGPVYPRRDQLDQFMVNEVASKGLEGWYVYRETSLPLSNGGVGELYGAPAPADTDRDGMPDAWEDANGLNKANPADAVAYSATQPEYLNIEVYVNQLLTVTPPDFLRPPGNLTLNASTVETPVPGSKVVLTWSDNTGSENGFVVERSLNGTSFSRLAVVAANTTTYTDDQLTPNTLYYYRLKAVNTTDTSSYTSVVSRLTPPLPSAPVTPGNPVPANEFQYAEAAGGNLTLKWTGSSNTTSYDVYLDTVATGLALKATLPYAASPSYTATGLLENKTYYWRIDARNANGTATGTIWHFRTNKIWPKEMIGWWSFDDTTGSQITDSSSYLNHGVLGLNDDDTSVHTAGKIRQALDFATADTGLYVINVPHQDHLYLDKGSFSVSFWMKAPAALMPTGSTASAYLLCKGSITRNAATGATGKRFNIEFKSSQLRFAIDDDNDSGGGGKDELQVSGPQFFTNDWVHVVAIRDTTTKKLRVYANAALAKEQTITKAFAGIGEASDLIIGNIGELEFLSNANTPAPYKGKLDELKIFSYALSDSEILRLYHVSPLPVQPFAPAPVVGSVSSQPDNIQLSWRGGVNTNHYKLYVGTTAGVQSFVSDIAVADAATYTLTGLAENTTYYWRVAAVNGTDTVSSPVWNFKTFFAPQLVGHWKMDENDGSLAADASTFRNDGLLTGMTNATRVAGKYGNAVLFGTPAASGSITIPNADQILFDNNGFTISMWVNIPSNTYTSSGAKDCYLLHKGSFEATTGKWYGLQLRDGKLTFAIDDGITKNNIDLTVTSGANNLFTGTWKHVVAVKDAATRTLRLYIEGVQALSGAYTAGTIGRPTYPLTLGNSTENKPFRDRMDDVRMYNFAFSPAQVAALFNDAIILPVRLTRYSATLRQQQVALEWTTTQEKNSSHFEVERSADGQSYSRLLTLAAAGNTTTGKQYTAYDPAPVKGLNYYRLLQYDQDGYKTDHGIRVIRMEPVTATVVEVSPNPASGWFNLQITAPANPVLQVQIMDITGRVRYRQTIRVQNGAGVYRMVPAGLSAGYYQVVVEGKDTRQTIKIYLQQ